MTTALANETELYLVPGGAGARLIQRMGIHRKKAGRPLVQRIVGVVFIAWAPMCLFALLEGRAIGPTPRDSFLLDLATYARFFIALPLLLVAEVVVGSRLRMAGLRFVGDGFVRDEDLPAFERAVARLARGRDSLLAMLVVVALAAFGGWKHIEVVETGIGGWRAVMFSEGRHHLDYSLTALWNNVVAVPIVLFLFYRWLWRILIWTIFLANVARLELQLVPTHADKAGGLGFLAVAHASFAIIAFGLGSVISAQAAFRVLYEGASISAFQVPLVIVVAVSLILFLGPLLVFCPTLVRSRRAALATYGALVDDYNRAFHGKWIGSGTAPPDEPLLGSADIQSLADLGNSFRFVDEMGTTPFGRRAVVQLAVAAALPCVPLVLLVMPLSEVLDHLAKLAL